MTCNLSDAWAAAQENISVAQLNQKHHYDKHSKDSKLNVGDRVMVYMPQSVTGKAWKLARPFYGPYRVLSTTPTNVEVQLIDKPDSDSIFVAHNRVRLCYPELPSESWSGPKSKRKSSSKQKSRVRGDNAQAGRANQTTTNQSNTGPITRSMSKRTVENT